MHVFAYRRTAPYPLCATNADWGLISTESLHTSDASDL